MGPNWPQVFCPDSSLERVALFHSVCGGCARLHVPVGVLIRENSELSVASSWGARLRLAQDKPGQWFSNCLAGPRSVLGVVSSGVLNEVGGGGLHRLGNLPSDRTAPLVAVLCMYRGSG